MQCKPIYEFLLWDNCNNHCKFCFQRPNPRLFNFNQRKVILDNVITFLESDEFIKGSHILVVGGEIFDKVNDFPVLKEFFDKIVLKMLDNTIDLLYINTNLIYKDMSGVWNLLDCLLKNNLLERLRFTTSYDLAGRFKNKEDKELMLRNLKSINVNYPKCPVVTNIILTKQVCNAICDRTLSIKNFMKEYTTKVNLIPYIIFDETLAPDLEEIVEALQIVDKEVPGYISRYILNLDLAQDKLLYKFENGKFNFCSCENGECGHSINFKRYSNHGSCFICDLKRIFHDN